jgi:replicative DNA helicase
MIEPLDAKVRAIARGQIGLIIAPYKRGKSLMLIWIAVAYVLQRLNVLFITLEDPPQDVEDRFDACITFLPIKKLEVMPRTFKERFLLFKRLIRSRLKIVDRTERKTTIRDIEAIIEEERNKGFIADAVIIDYDDEIAASKRNSERRLELAEIYRDMRQLAAKKSLLVWTAAQSRRSTAQKRQLGGDDLAEDISKVLKVAMAISLGQGDWGPESIYLWVAAHKFDRQHVGANIMTNKNRMLIYDREKTLDAERHPKKYMVHEEGGVKYE